MHPRKKKEQQKVSQIALSDKLEEQYKLNYMFDFEYSDSLLNIEMFENPFDYKSTMAVRGILPVCIILHHISQALVEKAVGILFLHDIGVLFVGFFFFYSILK